MSNSSHRLTVTASPATKARLRAISQARGIRSLAGPGALHTQSISALLRKIGVGSAVVLGPFAPVQWREVLLFLTDHGVQGGGESADAPLPVMARVLQQINADALREPELEA